MGEPKEAETKADKPERPPPKDELVETSHTAMIGGTEVAYRAICGTIVLREELEKEGEQAGESEGHKPRASVFFVAYLRDGVDDPSTRPLTFAYNGGPGSAAVWLQLGALGPRRVDMGDVGELRRPPFGLVDNADSLLDVSDLVFVDPVGTGFSRALEGEKGADFHRLEKDVESVGEVIRLFTTRYGRWRSPTFLIGESYRTTRAASLARQLQSRHGLYLNGIALVSAVLDFSTIFFGGGRGNDLPHDRPARQPLHRLRPRQRGRDGRGGSCRCWWRAGSTTSPLRTPRPTTPSTTSACRRGCGGTSRR